MSLSKIRVGTSLMLDANIMAYTFLEIEPFTKACQALVRRASRREINLYTDVISASAVVHRAMVVEAAQHYGLKSNQVVSYLKKYPKAIKELTQYKRIPSAFTRARIRILDVTSREIHHSKKYRDTYGLLTNDSILLAVMERYKLTHLVTNDKDFKRVREIKVWSLQ